MAISRDYIAELSRRIDITELIGGFVELKRAGRMERGLCPFHNEKTPSFYVYPETNSFFCFGCNAAGDAITFVMRIQNLEYVEAVKYLAARAGMPMPDEDDTAAKIRSRMLAANRESARFYAHLLNAEPGKQARVYLRGRGLTDATIRRFGLGYAPDTFGELRNHLQSMGFSQQELLQTGLIKQGQKGTPYDAFRNRIIFPIIDRRGNVIAFGGRRMAEAGPKYLNSADTPVFKKGRELFALNIARKSTSRRYLLAEGYMDVISLHQAGFDTAVATLGTALTGEQAKLVSDYADEVVLCYDSDEAGQRATARAIEVFKNTQVKVSVLNMVGAKDPDEFIEKFGAERFEQLLEGSNNTIEYAFNKVRKGLDITTPDGKVAYLRAALNVLAAEAGPVERDIYAGRIAEETDVSKEAVLTQLQGVVRNRMRSRARQREKERLNEGLAAGVNAGYNPDGSRAVGVAFAEQQLLAALIKNPADYLPLVAKFLQPAQFLSKDMGEAYALIMEMGQGMAEPLDLAMLSGSLPEKTVALLGKILAQNYDTGFTRDDVEMFVQRICRAGATNKDVTELTSEEYKQYMLLKKQQKENTS